MTKRLGYFAIFGLVLISLACMIAPGSHPAWETGAVDTGDVAWVLTSTALVLLMTPGLSFFYGGMVRSKNVLSTMLQSFIAMGVVSVLWFVFGFSLSFGESIGGLIGNPFSFALFDNVGGAPHAEIATAIPFMLFAAFQLKFAIITPALITGSFAERIRFWSYVIFMVLFAVLIYCPLAHWIWHPDGFLAQLGVLDFAGGAVIHLSAGIAALAGALVLGKRTSHANNELHEVSHIPYIILGTGLLWFGWFGFNAGSSLEANDVAIVALLNTNMASATAMAVWILLDIINNKKPNSVGACIGAVVGLATITPAAGYVDIAYSIPIGLIAAVCSYYAVHVKNKSGVDDTLDVFPCHGVGGIVGMLLTGVFASEGGLLTTGSWTLLGVQALTVAIVSAYTFGGCWLIMKAIDWFVPLRVSFQDELTGLDISQHNEALAEVLRSEEKAILLQAEAKN